MKPNPLIAIWKDPFSRNMSMFTIVILILLIGFIYWDIAALPPEIPLYFSLANPADQLAARHELVGLPIIISGIVTGNLILAVLFFSSQKILSKILMIISALIVILMFITLINITLLIT